MVRPVDTMLRTLRITIAAARASSPAASTLVTSHAALPVLHAGDKVVEAPCLASVKLPVMYLQPLICGPWICAVAARNKLNSLHSGIASIAPTLYAP